MRELIYFLQWAFTFFYYQKKKKINNATTWCLHCRLKNKEKDSSPNNLKRLPRGELGQVIRALVSKIFRGLPGTHIPQTNLPANTDSIHNSQGYWLIPKHEQKNKLHLVISYYGQSMLSCCFFKWEIIDEKEEKIYKNNLSENNLKIFIFLKDWAVNVTITAKENSKEKTRKSSK